MPTTQVLYPTFHYRDAAAAIDWLVEAYGCERLFVTPGEDGSVAHGELVLAGAVVMVSTVKDGPTWSGHAGEGRVYVAIDDVDALAARAQAAGATVLRGPEDTDYGSRECTLRDPEGNLWSFGTYRPGPDGD
ncbi:VOC family protein [Patulibacter defluvii]|uniref:VOC family protein n=1 Tax=Patulibacter defluvii TaxID=3095358 RepID=UPI002A766A61|nr:VOC family protein [Patulibacter sp. DM4]